jgi:hypothetical protein
MTQLRRWGTIQDYVDLCRAHGYFTPEFYATAIAHMERIHVRHRLKRVRDASGWPTFGSIERLEWSIIGGSWSNGAKNVDPLQMLVFIISQSYPLGCLWGHNSNHKARGRKPLLQARFNAKRGENQGFMSLIGVGSNPHFPASSLLVGARIDVSCTLATGTPYT